MLSEQNSHPEFKKEKLPSHHNLIAKQAKQMFSCLRKEISVISK